MDQIKTNISEYWNHFLEWIFTFNYYRMHLTCWIIVCFISSIIIYLFELQNNGSYIDALYTSTTAFCTVGLTSIDFSKTSIGTQITVFVLMQFGNVIFMSIVPLIIRRYFYRKLYATHFGTLTVDQNIEYRALYVLMQLKFLYFFLWELVGFIFYLLYFFLDNNTSDHLLSLSINRVWAALFFSVSAFNNIGLSLLSDSFFFFRVNRSVLLFTSILILLGYTCYPAIMRLIILIYSKLTKDATRLAILEYILENPRRCSTHLYPIYDTLYLVSTIVSLFTIQFVMFVAFEINNEMLIPIMNILPVSDLLLVAFFTSISTRICGLSTVAFYYLHPGMTVLLLALMYLSPYPLFFIMKHSTKEGFTSVKLPHEIRNEDSVVTFSDLPKQDSNRSIEPETFSNVKSHRSREKSSIKIVPVLENENNIRKEESSNSIGSISSFFRLQLKNLFLRDIFWVYFGYFVIGSIEYTHPSQHGSLFALLFEIISAYGTIGLTMGDYNGNGYSSGLHSPSKLALIIVMIMGRHRGIPDSLDAAVDIRFTEDLVISLQLDQLAKTNPEMCKNMLPIRVQNIINQSKDDFWYQCVNSEATLHSLLNPYKDIYKPPSETVQTDTGHEEYKSLSSIFQDYIIEDTEIQKPTPIIIIGTTEVMNSQENKTDDIIETEYSLNKATRSPEDIEREKRIN